MFTHRFQQYLPDPVAVPAGAPAPFVAPTVPVATDAVADIYRLAYEIALTRVVARRRCFAPFSLN